MSFEISRKAKSKNKESLFWKIKFIFKLFQRHTANATSCVLCLKMATGLSFDKAPMASNCDISTVPIHFDVDSFWFSELPKIF
jgi:hypothetical protein